MPIYAYACRACGHQFDRLQRIADPDPLVCPVCEKPEIARQVTAPSFRLAGSGWYETDFKKDGDKKRNLAGDAGASPAAPAEKPAAAPSPAVAAAPASGSSSTKSGATD